MSTLNKATGSITFITGSVAGKTYPINSSGLTIGREPGNTIVIADPSISRQHAQIVWNNAAWIISKRAPQNRLTVNQQDVQQASLHDRDIIGLGADVSFRFQIEIEQSAAEAVPPSGNVANMRYAGPPPVVPPIMAAGGFANPLSSPSGIQPPRFNQSLAESTQRAPLGGTGTESAEDSNGRSIPTLEVSTNTDREKHTFPLTKQIITIGRDPESDVLINRPTISGFHAQIIHNGNELVFIHPHPARGRTLNGITYQGRVVAGDEQFRKNLVRGDVFRIIDEHGTFVTLTYNDGSGAPQDILPDIRPVPLGAPVITLGRLPDNTVVLDHPQVSGHHARLELVQGGYRILDLGATNHVYVNAKRVSTQALQAGDEIRIGPFKLTYTGTQLTTHDESNSVRIDAIQLKKVGNKETILLNDLSIAVPPRKFVALVGGSGAGKSTLMDALNGLRPAQQGTVFYNGQDYYRNLVAFSTQLGYVPQDDIIHRDLTVERALYYAARLRLPSDFSEAQIQQRINEVLDDVEMKFRRTLLVSKLSGGQRKRVSIALELLANPSVFFLDEPTSGLDPGLDRKMMLLLRKLADKGHTIVLVTHATNNINACDYVCFLSQGGRLAYYGPPEEAKAYFGRTDFAEIYSILEPTEENKDIPAEAEAKFRQSSDFQRYVVEPLNQRPIVQSIGSGTTGAAKRVKRGNPWKQFSILSQRYIELLRNDVGNLLILLLQAPIIGLILLFLAGHGTFDPTSVANCPLRANPLANTGPIVSINCQHVVDLLQGPQGDVIGDKIAAQQGVPRDQLLQKAIRDGSGSDAQKILFIMAFAAVMFGCINGAREIVKEAPVYRRERAVNLGIMPYMFSKIAVLGVLCLFQSGILVLMVNLKAPLQQGIFLPPLLEIYITMALTALAGLMVGLTLSAIAPNNDRAMSFVPIILIPQVIFSGIIFALDNPLLQFLGAFFPARWAMAGMGSSVGLHGDKLGGDNFSYQGTLFSNFTKAQATGHLLLIWFALFLTIIVLGIATAYFLKRKDIRS